MYPPSPYAVPVGSFRTPVAIPTTDPLQGPFFYIGINCDWMPLVVGALKQLLLESTWATNDMTTLQRVQGEVFNLIAQFNCATAPTLEQLCGSLGAEGDCDMSCCLRWENGVLQQLSCGVWTDLPGLPPGGVAAPGQPGAGSPQPQPGGGCQQYHAVLPGNGQWLLPTSVRTGDTLDVSGLMGVSYDGTDFDWHCPEGDRFFAGLCTGVTHLDGSNPMPAVPEMRVIAKIGSTYYDLIGSLFTVPGGIIDEQVTFLLNSASPTSNSGVINFDVTACNNQAAVWSHTLNLRTSPYGFTYVDGGQWIGGTGLQSSFVVQMPNNGEQLNMKTVFSADVDFTDIRITFDTVLGTHGGTRYESFGYLDSGLTYHQLVVNSSPSNGTGQTLEYAAPVTARGLQLVGVMDAIANPGTPNGSWTIYTLFVAGTGFDPFV